MRKQIVGMLNIFMIGSIVAFLLIIAAYVLPTGPMKQHMEESAEILLDEGIYPTWKDEWFVRMHPYNAYDLKTMLLNNRITSRDNYTDALMLLQATYDGSEPLIERAMAVYRYTNEADNPFGAMDAIVQGKTNELERAQYDRYWHGYLVFLKPLLLIGNIALIRWVNVIVMVILLAWVCILIRKRLAKAECGWFLYSLLFLMPFTIPFCMQYCTSTYVMLVALIVLLKNVDWLQQGHHYAYYFMIVGMAVVYVDYLTFPLITFGIPVIFVFLLDKSERSFWKDLIRTIRYGIDWSIGYVGLWAMKWVLASIVLHQNVVKEGIEQVLFRSSSVSEYADFQITILKAWGSNVCNYVNILYIGLIIIGLILACKGIRFYERSLWKCIKNEGIFLVIAMMPFIWYGVFKNHSYSHGSFTFRCLMVTVFAGMIFISKWNHSCKRQERIS